VNKKTAGLYDVYILNIHSIVHVNILRWMVMMF